MSTPMPEPPDTSRSIQLSTLFPWVAQLSLAVKQEFRANAGGVDTLGVSEANEFGSFMSRQLLEGTSGLTLERMVPTLPPDFPISELPIAARMTNAFRGRNYVSLSDISSLSIAQIMAWPNVGIGSVQSLLAQLLIAAILRDESEAVFQSSVDNGWLHEVSIDIEALARWNLLIGRPHSSLFEHDLSITDPPDVVRARDRLSQLSAADIPSAEPVTAGEILAEALTGLGDRSIHVLRDRAFSSEPLTLDALGDSFGVTRERARQVESRALAEVREVVRSGGIGDLQLVIRDKIRPLASLDTLISSFPSIRVTVRAFEQPVWRILDRLDDEYEIRDGWCAIGTVDNRVRETLEHVLKLSGNRGYVAAEDAGAIDLFGNLSDHEQADWFRYCGLDELGGYLLPHAAGIADRAAVALEIEREPMTIDEVHFHLGVERSAGSIRNALSVDPRFTRVNRDGWALSDWGLTEYKSIRELIGAEIDTHGGEIGIESLVDDLTTRFGVAASSIVAYASAHPYRMARGIVRRMTSSDADAGGRSVWQTPRVYRGNAEWIMRTTLTSEHFRGSGSVLPSGLARALGVPHDSSREFVTPDGPQLVSWKSMQPVLGSIRRFIADLAPDDEAFLVFSDNGTFRVDSRRSASTTFDEILASAGLVPQEGRSPIGQLAESIGLGADAGISNVIAALRGRRDTDLAELLEGV